MSDPSLNEPELAEILARAGAASAPYAGADELRELALELWQQRAVDDFAAVPLAAAERAGVRAYEAGEEVDAVVRRVTRLGEAIVDGGQARGSLTVADTLRLRALAAEAAARAAAGWSRAARERREAWLSYLCHDLKNPLNTILNALWLLREHRAAGNADRFLDLAERAVRRLEGGIKDVRDLNRNERTLPRSKATAATAPAPDASIPPPKH